MGIDVVHQKLDVLPTFAKWSYIYDFICKPDENICNTAEI